MNKTLNFSVKIAVILAAILFYFKSCHKPHSVKGDDVIIFDTIFIDSTRYKDNKAKIETIYINIKSIEDEKDDKIKGIDTISNDSVVRLFYELVL